MTEKLIEQELRATIAVYRLEIDYLEDKIQGFNEQIAAIHKDIDADNEIIDACTLTMELLLKRPANAIPIIEETSDIKISELWPDGDAPELEQLPEDKPEKEETALFKLSDFSTKLPADIIAYDSDYKEIGSNRYQVIETPQGIYIKILANKTPFIITAESLMKIPVNATSEMFGEGFKTYSTSMFIKVRKALDDNPDVNPDADKEKINLLSRSKVIEDLKRKQIIEKANKKPSVWRTPKEPDNDSQFEPRVKTNTRPEKRTLDEVEI